MQRPLRGGVLRQDVERPRQRDGGRLVSSQQDRHRLVPQLAIGHRSCPALFVAREQQHAEKVAAVPAAATVLGDEPVDDAVELAPGAGEPQRRRDRNVQQEAPERDARERERVHRGAQRPRDRVRVGSDVGVEERLADDPQREAHHLADEVEHLPIAPLLAGAQAVLDHRGAV